MKRALIIVACAAAIVALAAYLRTFVPSGTEIPRGTVSAELADSAQAKLDRLARGADRRVGLAQDEVQSLLLYKYSGLIPAFVDSPRVEIADSLVRVHARVPVRNLPVVSELGDMAAILPDTTDLRVTGRVQPLDSLRVAFVITDISAAEVIVLPARLIPGVLRRIGRIAEPGLPADAVALPLPPGAGAAVVRGDSLILHSIRRSGG